MYIKLEDIINDLLVEEGKTSESDFLRYFKLGMHGMKELSFDVSGVIRTIELVVDSNTLSIDLPNDYVKYTKIGVYGNDGDVHLLGLRNQKSLISTAANSTQVNDDELNPSYFEYTQEYGLGGGNNANGYYRVDSEGSTIQFTSPLSGKKIILEYISNSLVHPTEGEVVVHEFLSDAMRAYIYWKSIHRKRGVDIGEKDSAKRDYYNQKRLARARMLSFTKQEALQTIRKPFKQAPKI
jgi:hypothetical protein|tara:strand:- start:65 stop:778 length:714 start_codon:yes stop_codon:yes gene_type:complete